MNAIAIEPKIETAARRLAQATRASAVVLFGSRARGDHHADSDWDLCVILPDGIAPQQFTPSTLWNLVADLNASIQVYPIRRSVFQARGRDAGTLSYEIARDGRVIVGSMPEPAVDATQP